LVFTANRLAKTFNRRKIFSEISFSLKPTESLAITGRNGSGKSTLLKILAGVLTPTFGKIEMSVDNKIISSVDYFKHIGFVSPYLQLYDEFSGWENLDIFRKVRNLDVSDEYLQELLIRVNLWERRSDYVRTYSSGMKQRLKYAFALIHKPPILLLDEPMSNLDSEGMSTVRKIMEEQINTGVLIIATNEEDDLNICTNVIDLNIEALKEKSN